MDKTNFADVPMLSVFVIMYLRTCSLLASTFAMRHLFYPSGHHWKYLSFTWVLLLRVLICIPLGFHLHYLMFHLYFYGFYQHYLEFPSAFFRVTIFNLKNGFPSSSFMVSNCILQFFQLHSLWFPSTFFIVFPIYS